MSARVKAAIAVTLVWTLAGLVIWAARSTKPTPQAVLFYLRKNESGPDSSRPDFVAGLAGRMNRLSFAERQQVKGNVEYLQIYRGWSPREKEQYLSATVVTDLRQTLEAVEKMPRDRRREFLDEVVGQAEWNNASLDEDPAAKQRVKRLAQDTLKDYFQSVDPDVREELRSETERLSTYLRIW